MGRGLLEHGVPRAKVDEQSQEHGLNYTIKIKSVTMRAVASINIYNIWPHFWITDSLRPRTHGLKESWIPVSKDPEVPWKVYLKITTLDFSPKKPKKHSCTVEYEDILSF
jgi:hypothetical protein